MQFVKMLPNRFGVEVYFTSKDHTYRVFAPSDPREPIRFETKVVPGEWKGMEHDRRLPSGPRRQQLEKAYRDFCANAESLSQIMRDRDASPQRA